MKIESEILLDSITPSGDRVTSFVLTLPKFLLQELNTHKTVNKNAASTRAIPHNKAKAYTSFTPTFWSKKEKGMQGYESISGLELDQAKVIFEDARSYALNFAELLSTLGLHQQVASRIFEPFQFAKVIATSDKWPLFFILRAQTDVEPNMGYLATDMLEKWLYNTPQPLTAGQWHIPFLLEEDKELDLNSQLKRSVARCARVSYMNFEGSNNLEKDFDLYDRLLESGHMSPFEHQVQMTPGKQTGCYSAPFSAFRHTLPKPPAVDLYERLRLMKEVNKYRGFTNE